MNTVEKKSCQCENCGNEAEMVITCTLPTENRAGDKPDNSDEKKMTAKTQKKQNITCKHCGNEAEMWIDM